MVKMSELILNSLILKEYPRDFKVADIKIQFSQLNQILSPLHDVCYYLHGGKLYFLGDEKTVDKKLREYGFTISNITSITLNPMNEWEIVRPVFYKLLRFYFIRHHKIFIWQPRKKNKILKEAFILEPEKFEDVQLVHEIYNSSGEKLLVFEGFRYWLEFLEDAIVLTLLPKVKPILPLKSVLETQDIILGSKNTYLEAWPALIKSKGFYSDFRKIALKRNPEKRNVLNIIVKLLSNGKEEIIVPIGNLKRGLVFSSEFIKIEEMESDFYGK